MIQKLLLIVAAGLSFSSGTACFARACGMTVQISIHLRPPVRKKAGLTEQHPAAGREQRPLTPAGWTVIAFSSSCVSVDEQCGLEHKNKRRDWAHDFPIIPLPCMILRVLSIGTSCSGFLALAVSSSQSCILLHSSFFAVGSGLGSLRRRKRAIQSDKFTTNRLGKTPCPGYLLDLGPG